MRSVLCLAVVTACLLAGVAPAAAQRMAPPSAGANQRAAADAEFNRARDFFDSWCKQAEEHHGRAPRDVSLTLRLADCRLLSGQLAEARALMERAEAEAGRAAVHQARVAATREAQRQARTTSSVRKPDEWSQACRHFEASLRFDVSPAAQLAVAACKLRRGELADARALLATSRADLSPAADDDELSAMQLGLADALLAEIDRLQPRLVMKLPPGFGGSIAVDERGAGEDEALLLDPGPHLVRATLRDGSTDERRVELGLGAARTVSIGHGRRPGRARRLAFWGLLGAGAASTIAAGISLVAMEREADRLRGPNPDYRPGDPTSDPRLCDRPGVFTLECEPGVDASSFTTRATLFQLTTAGALALFAGAAIVHFTAPQGERLHIAPAASGEAVGAVAAGRF